MSYTNKLFFIINNRIPDDPRVLPTIGNGHIATVVKTDTLCMNNLYNGYAIKTHRALLPAILVRNVSMDGNVTSKYSLDLKNGTLKMHRIHVYMCSMIDV